MLLCLVTTLSLPPSLRAPGTISIDKSRTPRFDGTSLLPVALDTTLNTSLYSLVPRWGLCACGLVCQTYSRAYLRHLFRAREITYFRLGTIHNLYYYLNLMKQMREAVLTGEFEAFKKEFYAKRA